MPAGLTELRYKFTKNIRSNQGCQHFFLDFNTYFIHTKHVWPTVCYRWVNFKTLCDTSHGSGVFIDIWTFHKFQRNLCQWVGYLVPYTRLDFYSLSASGWEGWLTNTLVSLSVVKTSLVLIFYCFSLSFLPLGGFMEGLLFQRPWSPADRSDKVILCFTEHSI